MLIINKYIYNFLMNYSFLPESYCWYLITLIIRYFYSGTFSEGDLVIFQHDIFILLSWLWEQSYLNADRPKSNIFLQSDSSSQH